MSLLAATLVFALAPPQGPLTRDQAELLEHLRVTYEANRAAFTAGSFRFDYTRGAAESDDDALANRLTSSATAQGTYVFDGERARYEIIYDAETMRRLERVIGESQSSSPLNAFRMLTDGRVALVDYLTPETVGEGHRHAPQIVPLADVQVDCEFPLELGAANHRRWNLAADIAALSAGSLELIALDAGARLDDQEVVRLALRTKEGTRSYWISQERGALPLRVRGEVPATGVTIQHDLRDIRFEEGHGWLPRSATTSIYNGKVVKRIDLREVKFVSPPASEFRMRFPEAVRLADRSRDLYYPVARKDWDLSQLPRADSPSARPLSRDLELSPAKPGEIEDTWGVWWLWPLAGGIVLTIFAAWVARSRRSP